MRAKLHKKWYNKYQNTEQFSAGQAAAPSSEFHLGKGGLMYLHLGHDVTVHTDSILGIYDMDTATWSKHTRAFMSALEKGRQVIPLFDDLPKSCILCEEGGATTLYISQLSTATLLRRSSQTLPEL